MKFEKFFNSKIFAFFEAIYRLIVLNLITVLFIVLGLGIFSLMPALTALVIVIRSSDSNTDYPIIKSFWIAFKTNYKRCLKLSFVYLAIALVLFFNTYFFYSALIENQGIINGIIYYISLIIDVIFIIAYINACFVLTYFPNLKNKKVFKYSFILLKTIPIQIIFMILLFFGEVYLLVLFPYILSFIIIALDIFIFELSIRELYRQITPLEIPPLSVFNVYDEQYYKSIINHK